MVKFQHNKIVGIYIVKIILCMLSYILKVKQVLKNYMHVDISRVGGGFYCIIYNIRILHTPQHIN